MVRAAVASGSFFSRGCCRIRAKSRLSIGSDAAHVSPKSRIKGQSIFIHVCRPDRLDGSVGQTPRCRDSKAQDKPRHRGFHASTYPQGGVSGRRLGHPVPAGDQGDAEGNAAGGRQAADPLRGRGGQGRRHRAILFCHRPRQERDRGPFRPRLRARSDLARARQEPIFSTSCDRGCRSRARSPIPASSAARARPCGVVRARSGRRRAVCGAARRRSDGVRHALPEADGRGL